MCVPSGPNSRLVQLNMLHCCQDDHSTLGAGLTAQMGPPMVILPTVGLSVLRLSPCEYCKCAILGFLFILTGAFVLCLLEFMEKSTSCVNTRVHCESRSSGDALGSVFRFSMTDYLEMSRLILMLTTQVCRSKPYQHKLLINIIVLIYYQGSCDIVFSCTSVSQKK